MHDPRRWVHYWDISLRNAQRLATPKTDHEQVEIVTRAVLTAGKVPHAVAQRLRAQKEASDAQEQGGQADPAKRQRTQAYPDWAYAYAYEPFANVRERSECVRRTVRTLHDHDRGAQSSS